MLPPFHLGVAYLLYAGIARRFAGLERSDTATLALLVGSVLPDLVDQPLARLVDVSSTRTLGHSLLFLVPICAVAWLVVRRASRPMGVWYAFVIGVFSHPLIDALYPIAYETFDELGFILWPVTQSPPYQGVRAITTVGDVTVTTVWLEAFLLAVALVVWWRDGAPGLGTSRP